MDDALVALGRRAVASPGWRWLSGMRWRFDVDGHRHLWSRYEGTDATDNDGNPACETPPSRRGPAVPDLSDPATLGCLLGLVREHNAGDPVDLGYHPDADPGDGSGWSVLVGDRYVHGTLGQCLVAALDAAPALDDETQATLAALGREFVEGWADPEAPSPVTDAVLADGRPEGWEGPWPPF